MTRLTRTESRQRNRTAVLEAARQHFQEMGYHAASVDAIAESAGFSKGVIYSQFSSKDDLFLTLLEERVRSRDERSRELAAGLSGPEGFVAAAREALEVTVDSNAWQLLLLEFRAHAARNPALQERYTRIHEAAVEATAATIQEVFRRAGSEPPVPARDLAVIFLALSTGFSAELASDPRLSVIELTETAARALVGLR